MSRPVITCARCKHRRQHVGRGLCTACYQKLQALGRLDNYELVRPEQTSMYCLCDTPTPARLALFHATYCGTCQRAIRGVT